MGFLVTGVFLLLFFVVFMAICYANKEDDFDKFYGYGDSIVTSGSNSDNLSHNAK